MLKGKKLLITGAINSESIGFVTAKQAQLMGAEVVLSALDRDFENATVVAELLPSKPEVLKLDITAPEALTRVTNELRELCGSIDGALHSIAFARAGTLSGDFINVEASQVETAFRTSAFSYSSLAGVLRELAPESGGSLVGMDFLAGRAWPLYNWMGVAKAALEATNRYLARDLGQVGIRSNLVSSGPLNTRAALSIPDFDKVTGAWESTSPLKWDPDDATPVADAVCFLLSDYARQITGEILSVDGGFHAMAAPLR